MGWRGKVVLPDVGGEEAGAHQSPVHGARGQEVTSHAGAFGPPGGLQAPGQEEEGGILTHSPTSKTNTKYATMTT